MKKILYSCLFGSGDTLKQPSVITPGWEYILYTDQDIVDPGVWKIEKLSKGTTSIMGPKLTSRYPKIKHPFEADISVYIDATYKPVGNLDEFVGGMDEGVHMTPHPQRSCVYKEAEVVKYKKLDKPEKVDELMSLYRGKYPENGGLFRCGVIVRIGDQKEFNETWWKLVLNYSWRDQLSAPLAAHEIGKQIVPIEHGAVEKTFRPHLHDPRKISNTVILNPSNINDVSKDAWICIGGDITQEEAEQSIRQYPLVHCISKPNALIYQGWLRDYISDHERFVEIVKIYRGTYAIYL